MTDVVDVVGGVRILNELRSALLSASRTQVAGVWSTIHDADTLDALVSAWGEDRNGMTRVLSTLESIPGCAQRTRNLRNTVERLADENRRQAAEAQVAELEASLSQVRALSGTLAVPPSVVDAQTLSQLYVPGGYRVDATGVFRASANVDGDVNLTRIASAPVFLAGRTIDVLTGEARRQVVWRGASGWRSKIVERRTVMDASRVIRLADYEAPISSNMSAAMVGYFTDFEAENAHRLVSVKSASRMGWLPDGSFLLADQHYSTEEDGDSYALTPAPGLETQAQGWHAKGTWERWVEAMELAKEFPLMMVSVYASCAAPLLEVMKMPGFVVDFSGETSGGKTTALRVASSVWGRPSESYPTAMYSWDATKVWIERTAGFLHNVPLVLDETKRAKHPNIVRDVIYDFCQGQGRGRGNPDGTRHMDSWRSVLISSGEGAATSFSQDAGTRARVISLRGKPLGNDPAVGGRISEELQVLLADNYGHLGRKIIEYLVAHKDRWDYLTDLFHQLQDRYIAAAMSAVGRRHAAYLALLDLSARIAHEVGLPSAVHDPFEYLIEVMNRAGAEADRPLAALQDTASWVAVNHARFFGRHTQNAAGYDHIPSHGWAGAWDSSDEWKFVGITSPVLKSVLADFGYAPSEILTSWDERGWLIRGSGRNRTKPVRVARAQARCYCLTRACIEAVMYDD